MRLHRPRSLLLHGAHLLVLCGFAFAQPLFDLLGATPEFFVVRGSTSRDVVLAALGLVLVPAALLLAVETVAGLIRPSLGDAIHRVFVAGLVALVALQALRRLGGVPGWPLVAVAAVVGALAALAYARFSALRTVVTMLIPAPFVFLALFLAQAPLDALSAESEAAVTTPVVESRTPVVVIVFDELPLASLLDEDGGVDAKRFPSFGALAAHATWYPRATTVHDHTGSAVSAILTGEDPEEGALPALADHPQNLFTYLARSYRMHDREPVTRLCPTSVCKREQPSFEQRTRSLASDLRIVYLHLTLPETFAEDLPPIDETWQGFDDAGPADAEDADGGADAHDRGVGDKLWTDQRFQFERWVDRIKPDSGRRPTLHFIHTLLPHRPWRYLPSGKQYTSASTDGLSHDMWEGDDWLVTQAHQRHLLHVGFADTLLGKALDRLRETGLYDRSLVVVAADHGAGFRQGDHRRSAEPTNIGEIAPVPLFVKLPYQAGGEVDERNARTTDVLPTIADVLGTPLPVPADGRSLLVADGTDRSTVTVARRFGGVLTTPTEEVAADLARAVDEKVSTFAAGSWESLYAIGPHPELVGRQVDSLTVTASELTATVDSESLLRDLDLSSRLVPANITGQITGEGSEPPLDLAIGVNGRIAAVTHAVALGSRTRFSAMVPESAFHDGRNAVEVFAVRSSAGGVRLERQLGGGSEGTIERTEAGETIRLRNGRTLAVVPGSLVGAVEDWDEGRESVRLSGWAADVENHALVDRILVFANGRLVYSTATSFRSLDVAQAHDVPEGAGFVFELPAGVVGDLAGLRVFAARGWLASELGYPTGSLRR